MQLIRGVSLTNVGFQLLMFGRRRQDLTPAQYRDHYENVHIHHFCPPTFSRGPHERSTQELELRRHLPMFLALPGEYRLCCESHRLVGQL